LEKRKKLRLAIYRNYKKIKTSSRAICTSPHLELFKDTKSMVGAIVVFKGSTCQTNKVPLFYSGVLEDHVFYVSNVQAICSVKRVVIDSSECIINSLKGMDGPTTFIFFHPWNQSRD
jgi:hypothetical protein